MEGNLKMNDGPDLEDIEVWKRSCGSLTEQIVDLQAERDDLRARLAAAEEVKAAQYDELHSTQAERDDLRASISGFEALHKQDYETIADSERMFVELKEASEGVVDDLRAKLAWTEAQLGAWKHAQPESWNKMKVERDELRAKLDGALERISDLEGDRDAWIAKLTTAEDQWQREVDEHLDTREKHLEPALAEIEKLKAEIEKLRPRASQMTAGEWQSLRMGYKTDHALGCEDLNCPGCECLDCQKFKCSKHQGPELGYAIGFARLWEHSSPELRAKLEAKHSSEMDSYFKKRK
jgi:DNA repair exonuclease SbcCD ATPase subunit